MTIIDEKGNVENSGEFPILEKGNNKITWIGNINKVEIIKRELFRG